MFEKALEHYNEALKIYRYVGEKRNASSCAYDTATLLKDLHRYKEAEPIARECVTWRQDIYKDAPDAPEVTLAMALLAVVLSSPDIGRMSEAEV